MPPPSEREVGKWLSMLGMLVAGTMSPQEVNERIRAYAPLLAQEFPAAAFNRESLASVARACKFFPTFGELCQRLSEWWRANRPISATLPPSVKAPVSSRPPRSEPSPDEIAAVRARVEDCIANLSASTGRRPGAKPRHLNDLALLETYERLAASDNPSIKVRIKLLRERLGIAGPVIEEQETDDTG